MKKKKQHKKTYYNDIALRLGHKLLGIEHLHYGYFDKGLKPVLQNLRAAQDAYVKNLLGYLPAKNVRTVLDVGCGTGGVAVELVKKKMQLTCLAPDPFLTAKTMENTGNRVKTITDLYENIDDLPGQSFDLVLMAESCQYIDVEAGWQQNDRFLRPGGYVLVSDFFKIKPLDRPDLSKSGHELAYYLQVAENHGYRLLKKTDITKKVAPTMDIYQSLIFDKVFPVAEAVAEVTSRALPRIYRLLRYFLKEKVEKLRRKYSNQNSKIFSEYKGYYILLFQKKA